MELMSASLSSSMRDFICTAFSNFLIPPFFRDSSPRPKVSNIVWHTFLHIINNQNTSTNWKTIILMQVPDIVFCSSCIWYFEQNLPNGVVNLVRVLKILLTHRQNSCKLNFASIDFWQFVFILHDKIFPSLTLYVGINVFIDLGEVFLDKFLADLHDGDNPRDDFFTTRGPKGKGRVLAPLIWTSCDSLATFQHLPEFQIFPFPLWEWWGCVWWK